MGPCDLQALLDTLPRDTEAFARLLETRDDAAVTQLRDDLCLVQTVDFFTPIVDDPYWFGQIAAANALADVYAMGARPLTAMNLVGWPAEIPVEHLAAVLRGGAEKVTEAGAELAGGHTIEDKEPKYGLAVLGIARPEEIVYNGGVLPGDVFVLTKPLGIGILASALKKGLIDEDDMMAAIRAAAHLNAAAAGAMQRAQVHACTDVTGFGLLGHLSEMLDASGSGAMEREEPLGARIAVAAVPLHERVLGFAADGVFAGGLRNNRTFLAGRVIDAALADASATAGDGGAAATPGEGPDRAAGLLDEPQVLALFDPQTSGGLLMAVPQERLDLLLRALDEEGEEGWPIGEAVRDPEGRILLDRHAAS
jgi:selenide,water dikinase